MVPVKISDKLKVANNHVSNRKAIEKICQEQKATKKITEKVKVVENI